MARTHRLVLVTGTPRSGTTAVGEALARVPRARELYEPTSSISGDVRLPHGFVVPGAPTFTDDDADRLIRDIARPRLRLRPGYQVTDSRLRRVAKRVVGSRTRRDYLAIRMAPRTDTIVWKDPFAAFLAERAAAVHGATVAVTVRSPEAVAASFKRLGWRFDVPQLVEQLRAAGRPVDDVTGDVWFPVGSAAYLWRLVYGALADLAARNDRVVLVDMDEFVADAGGVAGRIAAAAGLDWRERDGAALGRVGAIAGPAVPVGKAHTRNRDLRAANTYWRDVLDDHEVRRVREIAGDVWDRVRSSLRGS